MSKFKEKLRIIEEGLLKPMSAAEIKQVDQEKIKELVDEILSRSTKNAEGSIDVDGEVDLRLLNLSELPLKFNKVKGGFYCSHNKLTSLVGSPKEVGGYFSCYSNQLTSLSGAPREVIGSFYCNNNQLTTLEGAPKEVGGYFSCYNNKLTSLKGAPMKVGNNFNCSNNQLTTLEGAPKEVGGYFKCYHNNVKFTKDQVNAVCKIQGKIYVK